MAVLHGGERLLQAQRLLPHGFEEARLEHGVEHRAADRHRQRIAAEGRSVRAGRHALRRLLGGEQAAEREAAADALGDRHDVGRDAGPLMREQLAGAADAGLHLVEDQQQAVLVAQRPQPPQELGRRDIDAALALHRLDHDAGGLRPDRRFAAARSPNGTWSKPSTGGPKPSR